MMKGEILWLHMVWSLIATAQWAMLQVIDSLMQMKHVLKELWKVLLHRFMRGMSRDCMYMQS